MQIHSDGSNLEFQFETFKREKALHQKERSYEMVSLKQSGAVPHKAIQSIDS